MNIKHWELGDSVYDINLRCIRSYFRSFVGQPPLTHHQVTCNKAMKKCCQAIEWSYGDVSKYFSICVHPKHSMLAKKNPYAIEQLRVAHVMCNIYTCLNGDKASGHNEFCCPPPKLEDDQDYNKCCKNYITNNILIDYTVPVTPSHYLIVLQQFSIHPFGYRGHEDYP